MSKIIGLTGAAGSGKDTVREILERHHGFAGLAFADPIRDMLRELLRSVGASPTWMTDRALKESAIPELGASYRELAQTLGTEWGRAVSPDLWMRIVAAQVARRSDATRWVISDVRFANEAAWVKSQGGVVWRVQRDGVASVRAHKSETIDFPVDLVLDNNGSLVALGERIEAALVSA